MSWDVTSGCEPDVNKRAATILECRLQHRDAEKGLAGADLGQNRCNVIGIDGYRSKTGGDIGSGIESKGLERYTLIPAFRLLFGEDTDHTSA